jgi:hypothetical protein
MTHEQLAALDRPGRAKAIAALEADVMRGGQSRSNPSIATNLRAYEEKFGMSTAEMLKKFAAGGLPDDGEISDWLFWAGAADRTRVVR